MKRLLIPLAVLALPIVPATAQTSDAPASPIVYSIPFGSRANTVELAVANRSATEAVAGATVVLTDAPVWATVSPTRLDVGDLDPEAEAPITFSFDADRTAPVGVPAKITFEVVDGQGRVLEHVAIQVEAAAPAELALGTPYPNPSRDRATVPFEVPESGPVRVAVYDVLGREVGVLFDGEAEPGAHEAAVGGLASGTYMVRLVAGSEARVRRLTVVR